MIALMNAIENEMVNALGVIDHTTDPGTWFSQVVAVERGMILGDLTIGERPRLLVNIPSWKFSALLSNGHEGTGDIDVHLILDGGEGVSDTLHELARDVIKAVSQNESLGGTVYYCYPVEYEVQREVMENHSIGAATVRFNFMYRWTHDSP